MAGTQYAASYGVTGVACEGQVEHGKCFADIVSAVTAGEVDGFFSESNYIALLGGSGEVLGGTRCIAADADAVPIGARHVRGIR